MTSKILPEDPTWRKSLTARFLAKLETDSAPHPTLGTPCKRWTGKRIKWNEETRRGGYGLYTINGPSGEQTWTAHRLAWELFVGRVPDGLVVMHKCDVRLCANHEHLVIGTHKQNTADMHAKDRGNSGERHHSKTKPWTVQRGERNSMAKLTDDSVRAVRERYALGGITQQELAIEFGVSQGSITRAIRGACWSHVK